MSDREYLVAFAVIVAALAALIIWLISALGCEPGYVRAPDGGAPTYIRSGDLMVPVESTSCQPEGSIPT